jgi:hypothetical protein
MINGTYRVMVEVDIDKYEERRKFYDQLRAATFLPNEYWAGQSVTCPNYPPVERGVRFLDDNGDGKPDVIRGYHDYTVGTSTDEIQLNNSTPGSYVLTATTTWTGVIPDISQDGSGSVHYPGR